MSERLTRLNPNLGPILNAPYPFDVVDANKKKARGMFPEGYVIDFGVGDPTDPMPPVVRQRMAEAVEELKTSGYPEGVGGADFLDAVAGWLERRFGVTLTTDQLCATYGAKYASFLLPTYFCDPRDNAGFVEAVELRRDKPGAAALWGLLHVPDDADAEKLGRTVRSVSVSIHPGSRAFTRTPAHAVSSARLWVKDTSADFAAALHARRPHAPDDRVLPFTRAQCGGTRVPHRIASCHGGQMPAATCLRRMCIHHCDRCTAMVAMTSPVIWNGIASGWKVP